MTILTQMNNFNDIINNCESEIFKKISDFIIFLNKLLDDINTKIIKRKNKINFAELFYYIIQYNSCTNNTHRMNLTNFNVNTDSDIAKNTFINKLIKLNPVYLKNINDSIINYFYKTFDINKNTLICAVDGSTIKLLKVLKNYFNINKNSLYVSGYISCVYDINNNIPLYYDIFKSPNEVKNLIEQLKNDTNNITFVTDRGYDDSSLLNYYIANNKKFVFRLVKTNNFIKHLTITNPEEIIFNTTILKVEHKFKVVKYINVKNPDIKETKEELNTLIDANNILINNNKNLLITKKQLLKKTNDELKISRKKIKATNLKRHERKELRLLQIPKLALKIVILSDVKTISNDIEILKKENSKYICNRDKIIDYEHSDYYILTNNIDYTSEQLKQIYKKRWLVETSFKFDKTILNLNQMENKNYNIVKQNVYAIQFISIVVAFINKLLEKYIKQNKHLNTTHIINCLHEHILLLIYKSLKNKNNECENILKNNKKVVINPILEHKTTYKQKLANTKLLLEYENNILRIIRIFKEILKNQVAITKIEIAKPRIKKRQSNNKFTYRKNKIE